MNLRRVCTAALLVFVAYSLAVLVARRFPRESVESPPAADARAAAPCSADLPAAERRVVVGYFHGKERCETCLNLEAWTKEAVEGMLAEQPAKIRFEWQVVDFTQPADAHFDAEFKLGGVSTVVLMEMQGMKRGRWKALDDGLMLVATRPKAEVVDYVQREVRGFLEGR